MTASESPAQPTSVLNAPTQSPYLSPAKIEWSQALPAAAFAALVASILLVVPLGAFGLSMLAAGGLSVILYHRRHPEASLTPGMGARLGAVSGAMGFGIFAVVSAVATLAFGAGGQLRAAMLQAVEQSAARSSDPQAQQVVEFLKTPQGLTVILIAGMVFMFVAFLALSSLGGALGAILLRRKNRS